MAKPRKAPAAIEPPPGVADNVVVVDGIDGHKHYAWRRDGIRPVIDLDDFRANIHSALKGNPGADCADRVGPQ